MRGQYCKNGSSVSDSPRITRKLDIGRGQSEIRHPRNLPIIGLPTIRELFVPPCCSFAKRILQIWHKVEPT